MSKDTKAKTVEVEENTDAKVTEEETGADKEAEDAKEGAESDKDDAEAGDKEIDKIDYDAEIDAEKKRGKPDLSKAIGAFKERDKKREESEDDDQDKPLTRRDIAEIEARAERKALGAQALVIAKGLTSSSANADKEADLVIARWNNRSFPNDMSLADQIGEVFAGLHHKRIMGERNEALRALKGKDGVNKNPATPHRDAVDTKAAKMTADDQSVITKLGFALNTATKRWEKKLSSGDILVHDPKTGKNILEKKAK